MKARRRATGWRAPITALVLASAACAGPKAYDKPPTPVTVAVVSRYDTGTTFRYSATVKPAVEVAAAFKVGGYVDDLLRVKDSLGQLRDVQAGDQVRRGAALARVRLGDYEQRLAQATAGAAEADAMHESARLDFERVTRLYERDSLTKPEFDGARARADAAAAKLAGARAALAETQIMLDDATLRAPIGGVVLERGVERGSLVAPGQLAFRIADTSSVKVSFGVPDVVVQSLKIGRLQRIEFEAIKGVSFAGRITGVAPSPDPVSRVYEVELTIPNPEGRILVGFVGSLQLADLPGHAVVTVPLEAVVRRPASPEGYAVFLLEEEQGKSVARLRPVALGEALGSLVVVSDGLSTGQRVVVRGATLVQDGEAVRPLP